MITQLDLFEPTQSTKGIAMVKCPMCDSWFYRQKDDYNYHGTFDLHTLVAHKDFKISSIYPKVEIVIPEETHMLNVIPTVPLICRLPQIEAIYKYDKVSGYSRVGKKREYVSKTVSIDRDI